MRNRYVFGMAGLTGNILLVSSSIQYVINVAMTVPALLWVDRWGRRRPLLVGAFLMMSCLFINAAILASRGRPAPPGGLNHIESQSWQVSGNSSKAVIAFSYLFVASFAATWGPVSWIYPPELYPLRVRGKAVALSTSFNWAFNFALGYFAPPAFVNIKWKTYLLFGIFCAAMFVHVFFMFPETTGKTLEEIEGIFNENCGPANKQRAAETIDDPIEHAVQINFGTQCSAEINQGLAQIVPVAIEKFIEPNLELILDRSE